MNTRIAKRPRNAAFTLIELLTVIAIIAILMALLFPAIQSVRNTANNTHAKSDEMNIVASVKAYYTEYGKYPNVIANPTTTTGTTDSLVGDMTAGSALQPPPSSDNNLLFDILRNIADATVNSNFQANPRRVVFFEGKSVANPSSPKNGFLDNPTTSGGTGGGGNGAQKGSFYDPWGTEYFVIMDTLYANQIDVSKIYTDFAASSTTSLPQTGVGAFSFGKDRVLASPELGVTGMYKSGTITSDDIISWQ